MNRKTLKCGAAATVFSLVVSVLIILSVVSSDSSRRRSEAEILLQNQAAVIERNFIMMIERAYALRAFIIGSGGRYDNIDTVGEYILKEHDVRNILIAPNSVVAKVLPLDGNAAVLGMNLTSTSNKSYKDAITAINSREPLFSGPYELAQGGQALSIRLAIFIKDIEGVDRYWGLTSISVNFPDVISHIATDYISESGYDYVLYKKTASGEYKSVLERRKTKRSDFVAHDFSIRNMDFRFCVLPQSGWVSVGKVWLLSLFALFASITVGITISVLLTLMNKMAEKAGRDALTGLLNREGGVKSIDRRIKDAKFKHGAFLLMDVDRFKSVNDTMGHPKGDEVLIETGAILKEICRSMDIVCRLGGDEFVVFFSYDGDSDFVMRKAEDIRARMQRTVTSEEHSVDISASLGVSFMSDCDKNFDTLYKESDLALYNSKERGRNTVTLFDQLQP